MESCLWKDGFQESFPIPESSGSAKTDGDADVVIVGAGFTGLWTAHYLNLLSPHTSVVVVEEQTVGYGASGRNGGWCSALLPMSLDRVASMSSRIEAIRLQRMMHDTVDEVGTQARALGIDCSYVKGGTINLVRNERQHVAATSALSEAAEYDLGPEHLSYLDADEASKRIGATRVLGALFSPACAGIQPFDLVTGLARSLRSRGVEIREAWPAHQVSASAVVGPRGIIRARNVVRATEAYSVQWRSERRRVAPLYSMMIATEPLGAKAWEEIGLRNRETFADLRRMVIYGQRTADGRLAFGGRGAPYHFGSRLSPQFDRHEPTRRALISTLVDLFPCLDGAAITHHWGGPLAAPRDWTMGVDRREGVLNGGGYVGDGVATSNLVGRILADLVLERDTPLVSLPIVGHRSRRWEPEPFRWLGIRALARLAAHSDSRGTGSRLAGRIVDAFLS